MTMTQFSRDDMLIYQGREEGWTEGETAGKAKSIMVLLEDIGELSDSLKNLIMEQTDNTVLQKWLKSAAKATSIEDFKKSIGRLVSLK